MSTHSIRTIARTPVIVAVVVLALLAILTPTSVAEAAPNNPAPRAAAAPVDGLDLSGTMPNSTRDDLTGDFLNKGYAQRMRVEGNQLNIYAPDALGGKLLQSTTTDLHGSGGAVYLPPFTGVIQPVYQFSQYTSIRFKTGEGWPRTFEDTFNLSSLFLAAIDGSIYISGIKGLYIDPTGAHADLYQSLIYKVPYDGSCASQACAEVLKMPVVELPNFFEGRDPTTGITEGRAVAVTQMSAGYAHGKPYLAVGMSDYGVEIFDTNLNPVGSFTGMSNPGDPVTQTAVTALAWDPAGKDAGTDGLVTLGIMTSGYFGYSFDVNSDGSTQSDFRVYTGSGGLNFSYVAMSVAIGRRPNDPATPVAGFGGSDGTFKLVDTTLTNGTPVSTGTLPHAGVAVNPVPRTDKAGGTDWAVATQNGGGNDNIGSVVGVMFRDSGTTTLSAQPLAVDDQGNAVDQLDDATSYRKWFPGYKQGRFRLTNNSTDEVTVKLAADTGSGSGCWYAPANDPGALPADGVILEPGQQSDYYTLGAYTAGVGEGGCSTVPSPEDQSGAWRGYLTVAPTGRSGDTRLVNVQLNRNWTVDAASDQTGGSTTLSPPTNLDPTESGAAKMPYGYQTFTIDGPVAPVAAAAPTLSIHQVDSAVRLVTNGVYRVDVGPTSWTLAGSTSAAPQTQAVLPPFRVQGLIQGQPTDIGGFLPLGKVNAKTATINGTTTTTVAVSGGTFFWENVWGTSTPYTQLQVVVGTGSTAKTSSPAPLSGAPVYNSGETIAQMSLTPPSGPGSTGNAAPAPNGVDAAKVQVAINAVSGGSALPSTDPAYKQVYYRNGSSLITNLYPATCSDPSAPPCYDYSSFIGVQPSVTAYPLGAGQTATRRGSLAPSYDYVSSTLSSGDGLQTITGTVGYTATDSTLGVEAGTTDPSSSVASGQDGRFGFSVEGCNDFSNNSTCVLPSITDPNAPSSTTTSPALYQAGSGSTGPLLGVQLITQAQTATDTLPLTWTGSYAPPLASSVIAPPSSSYSVKLATPGNFSTFVNGNASIIPKVDATLVTHGVPVTLEVGVPPATNGAARPAKKARR